MYFKLTNCSSIEHGPVQLQLDLQKAGGSEKLENSVFFKSFPSLPRITRTNKTSVESVKLGKTLIRFECKTKTGLKMEIIQPMLDRVKVDLSICI